MKLVIIESPGKIEELKKILGSEYKLAACYGHIRDLPLNEMGVHPPDFIPHYVITESGERTVAGLKKLCAQADEVYLATDQGKEGEAISWHLQQALELKNYIRVSWKTVTAPDVQQAMLNPGRIDKHKVAAQEARRTLDRLVGYMVSPLLSDLLGKTLSAGRVQSVAVRLVVERERQIKSFCRTNHFGAKLSFENVDTSAAWQADWHADWVTKPYIKSADEPYILDEAFANGVAAINTVTVKSYTETVTKRSPPAPFITPTLQQAASVALKMSPTETMTAAQALFDKGHITYHRTDNPNVALTHLGDIFQAALNLGLEMADEPRVFKIPDGAEAEHPACTPTHWEVEEAGKTDDERALYQLIRERAIACQLADAAYAVRTATMEAIEAVSGKVVTFSTTGRTLVNQGWLALLNRDETVDEEDEEDDGSNKNTLPTLTVGQVLNVSSGSVLAKATRAPNRYKQASLIDKLFKSGIGRPATLAGIMEGIFERKYVIEDKRQVIPTALAEKINDALVGRFSFMEYGFTREIERDIDLIQKGELRYRDVVTRAYETLKQEIRTTKDTSSPKYPCPVCKEALRRREKDDHFFWGCSAFPLCKTTLPDANGEPGQRKGITLSEYVCNKCQSPLIHRKQAPAPGKSAFDFWVCSGVANGCKAKYKNQDGKPVI